MKRRKLVSLALGIGLALGMAGCGTSQKTPNQNNADQSAKGALVGVTMPTRSSERWIHDGNNVKKRLEELGYKVDLQYAGDDIPTQANQIDNQIVKGADLLIIAPIDGTALTTQLQKAADQNIPVISYDRLIRNSPHVDYYATFDNYQVGVQQATSLLIGLGVLKPDGSEGSAKGPFNIEVFAGSPDDNNSKYFYNGAMDTLQPYIDDGTLVVKSGQTDFETIATLRWKASRAQKRMEDLITRYYRDGSRVHGVLSPYDGLSIGILSALKSNGYGTAERPYPVVTGQDAEITSIKSIIAGEQYSTIFKDTRKLAEIAVKMADAVLKGKEPPVNNTTDYHNGSKVVPSYLLQSQIVTKENYKKVLIESGYYTASELQ